MRMLNEACKCIDEDWKALKARIQASITGITVNGTTHYQTDGTGICDLGDIKGTDDADEIFMNDGRSVETAVTEDETAIKEIVKTIPGLVQDVTPNAVDNGINIQVTDGNGTIDRMLIRADDSLSFDGLQIGISDATDGRITQAQADATDAGTKADDAQTDATDALTKANEAQDTADTALTKAATAQSTADTAKTTADGAQTDATNALTKANEAFKTTIAQSTDITGHSAIYLMNLRNNGYAINTALLAMNAEDFTRGAKNGYYTFKISDTIKEKINTASSTAETAETTAETAKTTAETAEATANTANDTANTANTTAETAKTTAETAKTTAETAEATANTANDTANVANSTASSAYQTAITAKTTAETADANADTALTKAKNAIVSFVTAVTDKILNATVTKGDGSTETVPLFTAGNNLSWNGKTLNAIGGASYAAGDGITLSDGAFSVNVGTGLQINATDKSLEVDSGTTDALATRVTNLEDTASAIQTSVDTLDVEVDTLNTTVAGKQATITGGASTIASSNLTANRALVSNSSGKVAVSAVTSTELGYLDGVTSPIQTQLNNKLGYPASVTDADESAVYNPISVVPSTSDKCGYVSLTAGSLRFNLTKNFKSIYTDNPQMHAYEHSFAGGLKICHGSFYAYVNGTNYSNRTITLDTNYQFTNADSYTVVANVDDTNGNNLWSYVCRVKRVSGSQFIIYITQANSSSGINQNCKVNFVAIGI